MCKKEKSPVLTARHCAEMEKFRKAVEVLLGERAEFVHFDFSAQKAKVSVGEKVFNMGIISLWEPLTHFVLEETEHHKDGVWITIRSDFEGGELRVFAGSYIPKRGPHGQHAMWWVGRSATERRLEPIESDVVARYARLRGMSVEEYLNLEA